MNSSLSFFSAMDPLVLSFWIFNLALCLSLIGSMVRRSAELHIFRKEPEVAGPAIKAGKVPTQARILMYLFKVPSYGLCMYSMYLVLSHEHWQNSIFAVYGATTLLLLWIPFEVRPVKGHASSSNLQALADRLTWLRWTTIIAPIVVLLIDSLSFRKLSIVSWLPTLLTLGVEYLVFHPKAKEAWLKHGIDFEKGTDNSRATAS
jgi:hypothetical protein